MFVVFSLQVNGVKPIKIRGRWTDIGSQSGVVCVLRSAASKGGEQQTVRLHWTSLEDFQDYDNPLTAGALVKSALVYTKIADLQGNSLQEQLSR